MSILQNRYPAVQEQARIKPFSETLREELEEYKTQYDLDLGALAAQIGVHTTAVSKYLNGKPEGDVERFERLAADVLRSAATRRDTKIKLVETDVSRILNYAIESFRKTNDFGLIHGPAGQGKTCGLRLYLQANPTACLITCKARAKSAESIERAIFDSIDVRRWDASKMRRTEFLEQRFKDSNRPLLVDNAQRLRRSGLEYLFDFHDETNIPVVLVGNPSILKRLESNDQYFSRVGQVVDIEQKLHAEKKTDLEIDVRKVIDQVAPEFLPCLKQACKVAAGRGRLRSLRKQLRLAQDIATGESFASNGGTLSDAFTLAHDRLIRDYQL